MMDYDGAFYRDIGDFVGARYLDWGFTRGTKGEVDFLVELLELPAGARILDVGCGVGRHSLELARLGFFPTGVDISNGLIEVATRAAIGERLRAEFIVADARALRLPQEFDAAICLCEGAFGLAGGDEEHHRVLQGVHAALRPNAPFVLTAINALAASRGDLGDRFDAYTATRVKRERITNPAGETRDADIYTTAFTYRELKLMLQRAGFVVDHGYGCEAGKFARKPLEIGDTEIMMISRRQ